MRKKSKKRKQEQKQKTEELIQKQQHLINDVAEDDGNLLTFGGHLEVFRQMLFRILGVAGLIAVVVFCFKDTTWNILMAPSEWDFCTYRWLEAVMQTIGIDYRFEEFYSR